MDGDYIMVVQFFGNFGGDLDYFVVYSIWNFGWGGGFNQFLVFVEKFFNQWVSNYCFFVCGYCQIVFGIVVNLGFQQVSFILNVVVIIGNV